MSADVAQPIAICLFCWWVFSPISSFWAAPGGPVDGWESNVGHSAKDWD